MSATPLFLGETERKLLADLLARAVAKPVNAALISKLIEEPGLTERKRAHMQHMAEQSLFIPMNFEVTLSIEDQPIGRMRHMSLTSLRPKAIPHPAAVWMIAKELGFWGPSIEAIDGVYQEYREDVDSTAVHILQLFNPPPAGIQ